MRWLFSHNQKSRNDEDDQIYTPALFCSKEQFENIAISFGHINEIEGLTVIDLPLEKPPRAPKKKKEKLNLSSKQLTSDGETSPDQSKSEIKNIKESNLPKKGEFSSLSQLFKDVYKKPPLKSDSLKNSTTKPLAQFMKESKSESKIKEKEQAKNKENDEDIPDLSNLFEEHDYTSNKSQNTEVKAESAIKQKWVQFLLFLYFMNIQETKKEIFAKFEQINSKKKPAIKRKSKKEPKKLKMNTKKSKVSGK